MNQNPRERVQKAGQLIGVNYQLEQVETAGRSLEEIKRGLGERVSRNQLDGYIIIPQDILARGEAEYYGRNVGDMITREQIEESISRAVTEERMVAANIDPSRVREMSEPVRMNTIKISESGLDGIGTELAPDIRPHARRWSVGGHHALLRHGATDAFLNLFLVITSPDISPVTTFSSRQKYSTGVIM